MAFVDRLEQVLLGSWLGKGHVGLLLLWLCAAAVMSPPGRRGGVVKRLAYHALHSLKKSVGVAIDLLLSGAP
jgi:hypothetical protein